MAPASGLRVPRGRTRPGRLRALDLWLLRFEGELLARRDGAWASAPVIDVGLGERPDTTLELAELLARASPGCELVGVEVEPRRAAVAERLAGGRIAVRQGAFEQLLGELAPARLVRAMNLLRGHAPERAPALHARLAAPLLPGGLVLEGVSDAAGHVLAVHLLRRASASVVREALLFHTDGALGFAPILFRDHLPRDLRRSIVVGHPLHDLFLAWTAAWQSARDAGLRSPRELFRESASRLSARVPGVVADPWLAEHGYLVWAPKSGVPHGVGQGAAA